jgi:hypothetical protein
MQLKRKIVKKRHSDTGRYITGRLTGKKTVKKTVKKPNDRYIIGRTSRAGKQNDQLAEYNMVYAETERLHQQVRLAPMWA